jgi:hypothetical protein
VVFEKSNDLVDDLYVRKAASLRLPNLLGVAAAFGDEVVYVEHIGDLWIDNCSWQT